MKNPHNTTGEDTVAIHLIRWDEDILRAVLCEKNAERYHSSKAYSAKAVSRLTGIFASMLFFGGQKPERLISHNSSGKPYMEGREDMTVSISHCGSSAVVSLSDVCHGIDIERPRTVKDNLTKHVFSEDEKKAYNALQSDHERSGFFISCWTRKEALIKTGAVTLSEMTGVSSDRDSAEIGGHVYWWDTVVYKDLYLSLCSRDRRKRIGITEENIRTQLASLMYYREFYE